MRHFKCFTVSRSNPISLTYLFCSPLFRFSSCHSAIITIRGYYCAHTTSCVLWGACIEGATEGRHLFFSLLPMSTPCGASWREEACNADSAAADASAHHHRAGRRREKKDWIIGFLAASSSSLFPPPSQGRTRHFPAIFFLAALGSELRLVAPFYSRKRRTFAHHITSRGLPPPVAAVTKREVERERQGKRMEENITENPVSLSTTTAYLHIGTIPRSRLGSPCCRSKENCRENVQKNGESLSRHACL